MLVTNEQIEGCVMANDEHLTLMAYKKEEHKLKEKKHEQNRHRNNEVQKIDIDNGMRKHRHRVEKK